MNTIADFNAGTRRAIDTNRQELHCWQCSAFLEKQDDGRATRRYCNDHCRDLHLADRKRDSK